MTEMTLRPLRKDEWYELADLIAVSLNHWYQTHSLERSSGVTTTEACLAFPTIYEDLDPGCCVVAEHSQTHRLMGGCFYHVRETHVSVGIMSVHPNYFGRGVASKLLRFITDLADEKKLPTRLVSSAGNLDSFSLYNRAGFVPTCVYQDMVLTIPQNLDSRTKLEDAALTDVEAMGAIEMDVSGIRRMKDYRYFIENKSGQWNTLFIPESGFLVSRRNGANATIGPGVARDLDAAIALLRCALMKLDAGVSVLVLVPSAYPQLAQLLYSLGARNTEIHLAQVRGSYQEFRGVTFPTFMPETG